MDTRGREKKKVKKDDMKRRREVNGVILRKNGKTPRSLKREEQGERKRDNNRGKFKENDNKSILGSERSNEKDSKN